MLLAYMEYNNYLYGIKQLSIWNLTIIYMESNDCLYGIYMESNNYLYEGGIKGGCLDPEIPTFYQPNPEIPTSKFAGPEVT